MLRKILLATVLALGVSGAAEAQSTVALASRTFGPATVDANGEALAMPDTRGIQTIAVQTVGTYSGTLELQCSVDGTNYKQVDVTPVSSQSPAANITTENVFNASVGGCTALKVTATAWTSGSVVVSARGTYTGGGGGGGGAATASLTLQETDDASIAGGQTADAVVGLQMAYDGSVWRRVTFGSAGSASSQVTTIQGIASGTAVTIDGTVTSSQTGTWTVQPGNTANTTAWLVNSNVRDGSGNAITSTAEGSTRPLDVRLIDPATDAAVAYAGACTWTNSIISANSVNETAIKASAGYIDAIVATNIGAAPVYLKLYNDTTANIDETDTPVARIMVPGNTAGAGVVLNVANGMSFSTAITMRTTTAIADNSTAAVAANESLYNFCIR